MRRRDARFDGGRVCEWGWGLRGEMGVYVLLGSCKADTLVLCLLCKNALVLQGSIFCTTEAPAKPEEFSEIGQTSPFECPERCKMLFIYYYYYFLMALKLFRSSFAL